MTEPQIPLTARHQGEVHGGASLIGGVSGSGCVGVWFRFLLVCGVWCVLSWGWGEVGFNPTVVVKFDRGGGVGHLAPLGERAAGMPPKTAQPHAGPKHQHMC